MDWVAKSICDVNPGTDESGTQRCPRTSMAFDSDPSETRHSRNASSLAYSTPADSRSNQFPVRLPLTVTSSGTKRTGSLVRGSASACGAGGAWGLGGELACGSGVSGGSDPVSKSDGGTWTSSRRSENAIRTSVPLRTCSGYQERPFSWCSGTSGLRLTRHTSRSSTATYSCCSRSKMGQVPSSRSFSRTSTLSTRLPLTAG